MPPPSPAAQARRAEQARGRVLAAWRGVDLRPLELAAKPAGRSVGELLPQVLAGLRLEERVAAAQIQKIWRQTIDPLVVQHAQPAGLVRGTLFVDVDSSTWLSEIVRYRRHEILERLQLAVGKALVQRISFRVG